MFALRVDMEGLKKLGEFSKKWQEATAQTVVMEILRDGKRLMNERIDSDKIGRHGKKTLRKSWRVKGFGKRGGEHRSGELLSFHPAAEKLNSGGFIRPIRSKMLAVPVGKALTSGGNARYQSPRRVAGLKMRMSKAGKLFLVWPKGFLEGKRAKDLKLPGIATRGATAGKRKATGRIPPIGKGDEIAYLLVDVVRVTGTGYIDKVGALMEARTPDIANRVIRESLLEHGLVA